MTTNILSISIQDHSGNTKSLPLFFDDTTTLAELQAYATDFLPALDAVIDGKIVGATVELGITLPGGLKSSAVDGNTVHEGANLTYSAEGTEYAHTIYVPTWVNAGFAGDTPLTTGGYATVQGDLAGQVPESTGVESTDKYGNDLSTYIRGKRAFRK